MAFRFAAALMYAGSVYSAEEAGEKGYPEAICPFIGHVSGFALNKGECRNVLYSKKVKVETAK